MVDFTSVLDKPAADIEKPKPMPLGTYMAVVQGLPKLREVGQDKSKVIDFNLKLIAPAKDVDQQKLAEWGDLSQARPLQKSVFYDTPDGQWALTQFLTDHLGIDAGRKSLREMLPESVGKQCLATLKHEPFVNSNGQAEIATRVAATAKM